MASEATGGSGLATPSDDSESAEEIAVEVAVDSDTMAAICNRVSRMLGLSDRAGLHRDLSIARDQVFLDLDALLAAPDAIFVEELLHIVECADRRTGSMIGTFNSRFIRQDAPDRLR
jgi:hypothetical protein